MQLVQDGHEPTTVPITLGRGAYPLHIKYENYIMIPYLPLSILSVNGKWNDIN
jgi:hypothetical protein